MARLRAAGIAAAVVTVAATKAAVVVAEEKAAGEVATDFRLKITVVRFGSRANRAGKRFTLTNSERESTGGGVASREAASRKSFAAYRGGKWLVAISVTAGARRNLCALHHHKRLVRRVQQFTFLTSTTESDDPTNPRSARTESLLSSRSDFELVADFGARAIDRVRGKLEHARRLE